VSGLRSLLVFGILIVLVWLSSVALLYAIDALIVAVVKESWARTVLGLAVFALWAFSWYMAIIALSRKLISSWARRASEGPKT
jgi:hypothetical protein